MAVVITVGGVDITDLCDIKRSVFTMNAGPTPGTCSIAVKDLTHDYSVLAGKEATLDIDGLRVWGGFIMGIHRQYAFPVDDTEEPGLTPRYFILDGSDYNILFSKRFVVNKADPPNRIPQYPAGAPDSSIVRDLANNYLYLDSDDISLANVTHVGTPQEDAAGAPFVPANDWGTAMKQIALMPGAIFFIDPDKVLNYADVDIENAPFALSDQPALYVPAGGGGPPTTLDGDTFTRTEADGWGTGDLGEWTYVADSPSSVDGSSALMEWNYTDPEDPDLEVTQKVTLPAGYMDDEVVTLEIPFVWPTAPSSGSMSSFELMVAVTDADESDSISVAISSFFAPDEPFASVSVSANWQNVLDNNFTSVDLVGAEPDGPATIKLEYDQTTSRLRGKYWLDSDPEPDWQVTIFSEATLEEPLTLLIRGDGSIEPYGVDPDPIDYTGLLGPFEFPSVGGEGSESTSDDDPAAAYGYRQLELIHDGTNLGNDALVWGAAIGIDHMSFARVEDEDSIEEHGRWQWADFRQDLYKPQSVEKRASTYVNGSTQNNRGHKDDQIMINCTVVQPGLRAGMKVRFISNVHGYNDVIPIRSMKIRFVNPTEALYDLQLSHYLDEAWNTAEYGPREDNNNPPVPVKVCEPVTVTCEDVVGGNWVTVDVGKAVSWGHFLGTNSGAPPEWIGTSVDIFNEDAPLDATIAGGNKSQGFPIEPFPFSEQRAVLTYYLPPGTTTVRASGYVTSLNALEPAVGETAEDHDGIVDDPLSVLVPWVIAATTWDEDQVDGGHIATVDPPSTGGWDPTGSTLATGFLAVSKGYVPNDDDYIDYSPVTDEWSFEVSATDKFQILTYTPGTDTAALYPTQEDGFSPLLFHTIEWTFVEGDATPGIDFLQPAAGHFHSGLNWNATNDGSDPILLEAFVPEVTTICEPASTARPYVPGTLTAHDAAGNPVTITEIDPDAGTFELGGGDD